MKSGLKRLTTSSKEAISHNSLGALPLGAANVVEIGRRIRTGRRIPIGATAVLKIGRQKMDMPDKRL